jgi:hypothetical protein
VTHLCHTEQIVMMYARDMNSSDTPSFSLEKKSFM